ncbi:hypothetical protein ACLOJK_009150 [Asimina triloba]
MMMKFTAALVLGLLLVDATHKLAATADTCATAGTQIQPCIPSLSGQLPNPTTTCCYGLGIIQKLESEAGVGPICNCTKGVLTNIPGLVVDYQASVDLLNGCAIKLGFSLSTTTGCST